MAERLASRSLARSVPLRWPTCVDEQTFGGRLWFWCTREGRAYPGLPCMSSHGPLPSPPPRSLLLYTAEAWRRRARPYGPVLNTLLGT
jgi:hypothetical protein